MRTWCGDAPIHSAAGNALRPQETLYGRRQRLVPGQERPIQSQRHPHRARFTVVAFQHLLRVRLKIKACHFQRAPTISRLHLERRRQQQISAPVLPESSVPGSATPTQTSPGLCRAARYHAASFTRFCGTARPVYS